MQAVKHRTHPAIADINKLLSIGIDIIGYAYNIYGIGTYMLPES